MEDDLATQIINECENFIKSADSSGSYLITTFDEKIDALSGISDDAKLLIKQPIRRQSQNILSKATAF